MKVTENNIITFRPITPEMLYARTVELSEMVGRNSLQIHQREYERAKLELTGEWDFDRQQAVLNRLHA